MSAAKDAKKTWSIVSPVIGLVVIALYILSVLVGVSIFTHTELSADQ